MNKQKNMYSNNQAILVKRKWLKVVSFVDIAMYTALNSRNGGSMKITE